MGAFICGKHTTVGTWDGAASGKGLPLGGQGGDLEENKGPSLSVAF